MDTPARFLLPTLAAALALAAGAVPPQTARLQQKFPAHGLAANVLANAAQDVPKLPSSSKWVASGGPDGKTEIVTFDPVEVWVDASRIGCWRDRQGNTLVLAEATCPAPLDAGDERFRGGAPLDAIMKAMDAFRAGWNPEDADLARWASAFSGREFKASSFTAVEHPPARLAAMKVCETSSGASCFFKFKSREPESWYWIDFTASRGLAPGDALRLVKNIAGGASRIRKTASGAPGPSGASGGAAPQADVRRESARRSISGMRGWWSDETPDYIFLSNMPSGAGRSLLQKVNRQMTPLRKAYARYVPPSHGVGTCVVRIFASLPEYREYVKDESGIPGSSSGLWSPARGFSWPATARTRKTRSRLSATRASTSISTTPPPAETTPCGSTKATPAFSRPPNPAAPTCAWAKGAPASLTRTAGTSPPAPSALNRIPKPSPGRCRPSS